MERWGVGTNSVFRTANVYREVGPWWVFFVEWFSMFLCDLFHKLPSIPLPNWRVRGDDLIEPEETVTMKEWYGDLQGLWHSKVDEPIIQWCLYKYETTVLTAEYGEVEELMPELLCLGEEVDDDDDSEPE